MVLSDLFRKIGHLVISVPSEEYWMNTEPTSVTQVQLKVSMSNGLQSDSQRLLIMLGPHLALTSKSCKRNFLMFLLSDSFTVPDT